MSPEAQRAANRWAPAYSLREQRLFGAAFLLLLAGTFCLIAYSAVSALPHSPVQLPMERRIRAVRWIPQGWSFFTRNPREEQLSYFTRDRVGRWRAASLGPVSHPRNIFGLNRKSRAQGVESAFLLAAVPSSAWVPCGDEEPEQCLGRLSVGRSVKTHSRKPTLTGIVGFVKREPVPWAWFAAGKKVTMPARAVVVRVE